VVAGHKPFILRLHGEGFGVSTIAHRLPQGVGEKTVRDVITAEGLTPNVPKKGPRSGGGPRPSEADLAAREGETVRTGCARCGDHFVGTLAQSRDWFSAHVCGEPVAPPVDPAPVAYVDRVYRERRPPVMPRGGVAVAVA
jgi:hypothetical protein